MGFATQAVVHSILLSLRPDSVRMWADRDPAVACVLLEETSKRVLGFVSEVAYKAFAPVPQRIARHLLDLATGELGASDARYVAKVTWQELANAVGTYRRWSSKPSTIGSKRVRHWLPDSHKTASGKPGAIQFSASRSIVPRRSRVTSSVSPGRAMGLARSTSLGPMGPQAGVRLTQRFDLSTF